MLEIKSKIKSYGINFPTSIDEVTPEMFDIITSKIKLPKYHCIVALCFKTKLFEFVTAAHSTRETNVQVVPRIAKIHDTDSKELNAVVGDKIIIDRSSLERSVHLKLPILINSDNAKRFFKEDAELSKAITTGNYNKPSLDLNLNKQLIPAQSPNIIILEFKIVPISFISASIPMDDKIIDPFKINENIN